MARSGTPGGDGAHGAPHGGGSAGGALLKFRNRPVTVMRGTEASAYGDETDVGIPYLTGVPSALAETAQAVFDAASQRQQIVRAVTCVMPSWADVVTTDTLLDESTGLYYMIEGIKLRPGPGYYPADKILSLRERSGVSVTSD